MVRMQISAPALSPSDGELASLIVPKRGMRDGVTIFGQHYASLEEVAARFLLTRISLWNFRARNPTVPLEQFVLKHGKRLPAHVQRKAR